MCINSRIENLQQQKADIDAKLQQLENLQGATEPLMTALSALCQNYRENAPEELPELLDRMLIACQIKESALAIAQSDNEAAQEFALEAMNQAIEKRAVEAFEIQMQDEFARPAADANEPDDGTAPDEFARTIAGLPVFQNGFKLDNDCSEKLDLYGFTPLRCNYVADVFSEIHEGWGIYFDIPNGGITGISICKISTLQIDKNGRVSGDIYDCSTETLEEVQQLTFDFALDDFKGILGWTKQVIDVIENNDGALLMPASEEYDQAVAEELALDDEEYDQAVAEELALDDASEIEISEVRFISEFKDNVEIPDMQMMVTMFPQLRAKGEFSELAGVTFNFNSWPGGLRLFSSSQTREEILDFAKSRTPKSAKSLPTALAIALATKWKQQQEEKNSPPQSKEAKEESEIIEFIRLSNSVGYIKRRDNGEIFSVYLGFSNKLADGNRTETMAKRRAKEWMEYLTGSFNIAVDKAEVRQPKRLTSENIKQPFAYEVKITGLTIGQIQKLAEEDFSLLPNEIALPAPIQPKASTWSITLNGYSFQSGLEEKIRTRFSKECLTLRSGGNMVIELWRGTEKIEKYHIADFQFTPAEDFDEISPEFNIHWQGWSARIWQTVKSEELAGGKLERLWRHNRLNPDQMEIVTLDTKEAAAIHAVRRMQGLI